MKERTNISMDPQVREMGKALAAKRRISFSQLIEELIEKADNSLDSASARLQETAQRIEYAASILERFSQPAKNVSYESKAQAKSKAKHS
jgi:predicted CopG family antitoxin